MSAPTPDQLKEYEKTFNMFDSNSNGQIDIDELERMVNRLQKRAINKADLQKMMDKVDLDKSGTIDFKEFCTLMNSMPSGNPEEEIFAAFNHFDTNKSGSIDREEVKGLFDRLGIVANPQQIADVIKLVDDDNNGEIDYPEFKKMYSMLGMEGAPPPATNPKDTTAPSPTASKSCCVIA